MPAFAYQALDADGRTQRGVLQGDTARAVRGTLRERGLNPLAVEEVREGAAAPGSGVRWRRGLSSAQLALLTRQLVLNDDLPRVVAVELGNDIGQRVVAETQTAQGAGR